MMTFDEIVKRQAWTLNQKIDHSVGVVDAFLRKTGKPAFVSFSGGKDSTVLLHLVQKFISADIHPVFCNTGNEYPEIVSFVKTFPDVIVISPHLNLREVLQTEGFPLISKETAQGLRDLRLSHSQKLRDLRLYGKDPLVGNRCGMIPKKWRWLMNEKFYISHKCCEILKKKPFAQYIKKTGQLPIIGTMASESRLRLVTYMQRGGCNVFAGAKSASYPLSIWTDNDIYEYARKFDVSLCSLYEDERVKRTGCMFCGFGAHRKGDCRFDLLYEKHPSLFRTVMSYENHGVTYREALHKIGVVLPDDEKQLCFNF